MVSIIVRYCCDMYEALSWPSFPFQQSGKHSRPHLLYHTGETDLHQTQCRIELPWKAVVTVGICGPK